MKHPKPFLLTFVSCSSSSRCILTFSLHLFTVMCIAERCNKQTAVLWLHASFIALFRLLMWHIRVNNSKEFEQENVVKLQAYSNKPKCTHNKKTIENPHRTAVQLPLLFSRPSTVRSTVKQCWAGCTLLSVFGKHLKSSVLIIWSPLGRQEMHATVLSSGLECNISTLRAQMVPQHWRRTQQRVSKQGY